MSSRAEKTRITPILEIHTRRKQGSVQGGVEWNVCRRALIDVLALCRCGGDFRVIRVVDRELPHDVRGVGGHQRVEVAVVGYT